MTVRSGQSASQRDPAGSRWDAVTLTLCFLICVVEGFDLAIVGITAPGIMRELGLTPSAFGLSATIVMVGFFAGSILGGRWGDRWGRAKVLNAGLALAAAASLATALTSSLAPFLSWRLLSGIGIGIVYPNVMVLGAAAAPQSKKARAIAIVSSGGSLGSLSAGLMLAIGGAAISWHGFYYIGAGAGAALLLAAICFLRDPSADDANEGGHVDRGSAPTTRAILFGADRARLTALIWATNWITSFIYYLVGYWLPAFMASRGLSPREIGMTSTTLAICAIGGGLAWTTAYDRRLGRALLPLFVYAGICVAFVSLAAAQGKLTTIASVGLVGIFLFGGQMLVYSLSALAYPPQYRSTGLGWAHAAGRLGGIASPVIVGALLQAGIDQRAILLMMIFPLIVAGLCATQTARWIGREAPPPQCSTGS